MAPEQAIGRKLDRRADVFSMGAVLYELLAGSAPYEAEHDAAILYALTNGKPVSALPAHVPVPIARVVIKALSHAREGRFATAAAMRAALASAADECNLHASSADVASALGPAIRACAAAPSADSDWTIPTDPPIEVAPRRTLRAWPLALGAALCVLFVAAGVAAFRARTAPNASAATAESTPSLVVAGPPPREAVRAAPVAAPSAVSSAAPRPRAASASPRVASSPTAAAPPVISATAPATASSKSCDPPYVVDSAGRRMYRRECL
jgi:serine/threonine-protein kinase